jgi:hypothetical protein
VGCAVVRLFPQVGDFVADVGLVWEAADSAYTVKSAEPWLAARRRVVFAALPVELGEWAWLRVGAGGRDGFRERAASFIGGWV